MKPLFDPDICWQALLTLGHFLWQGAALVLAASAAAWLHRRVRPIAAMALLMRRCIAGISATKRKRLRVDDREWEDAQQPGCAGGNYFPVGFDIL